MKNMSRNNPLLSLVIEYKVEGWARLLIEESFEFLKNQRRNKVEENPRLRMKNEKRMRRSFKEMETKKITTTMQLCMKEKVLETNLEGLVKKLENMTIIIQGSTWTRMSIME